MCLQQLHRGGSLLSCEAASARATAHLLLLQSGAALSIMEMNSTHPIKETRWKTASACFLKKKIQIWGSAVHIQRLSSRWNVRGRIIVDEFVFSESKQASGLVANHLSFMLHLTDLNNRSRNQPAALRPETGDVSRLNSVRPLAANDNCIR